MGRGSYYDEQKLSNDRKTGTNGLMGLRFKITHKKNGKYNRMRKAELNNFIFSHCLLQMLFGQIMFSFEGLRLLLAMIMLICP